VCLPVQATSTGARGFFAAIISGVEQRQTVRAAVAPTPARFVTTRPEAPRTATGTGHSALGCPRSPGASSCVRAHPASVPQAHRRAPADVVLSRGHQSPPRFASAPGVESPPPRLFAYIMSIQTVRSHAPTPLSEGPSPRPDQRVSEGDAGDQRVKRSVPRDEDSTSVLPEAVTVLCPLRTPV
jgi:hypothetical protein